MIAVSSVCLNADCVQELRASVTPCEISSLERLHVCSECLTPVAGLAVVMGGCS